MQKDWHSYWKKQSDARHALNQSSFHEQIASEIAFHLGDISGKKILELGCGDGALIEYLPIKAEQYTGVDFSKNLLEIFKQKKPQYKTHTSGAIEFLESCTEKYDLIFSFGVLQYFDKKALEYLFNLQKKALNKDGSAFHFGIPVTEQRNVFVNGQGTPNTVYVANRPLHIKIKSRFYNNIGHWHSIVSLREISEKCGYQNSAIFGGIHYLYRINLLQQ